MWGAGTRRACREARWGWLRRFGDSRGRLACRRARFAGTLSGHTACGAHHEAPGLGAAEDTVRVCDGGERGARHQEGPPGAGVRGCGVGARCLLPAALLARAPGALQPPSRPGAFFRLVCGGLGLSVEVWGPCLLLPELQVLKLTSYKGGTVRGNFSADNSDVPARGN